uniref:DEAD/DEAH-box helicase domain-containing protein n=1 Tax=Coleochaete scutata TaxID=3125 RepID=A0A5P9NXD8_COLSC|nr:hypothetical protein [Coleochaete scutata]QFU80107.1 hypothetical protein [Coleochaete scutata]
MKIHHKRNFKLPPRETFLQEGQGKGKAKEQLVPPTLAVELLMPSLGSHLEFNDCTGQWFLYESSGPGVWSPVSDLVITSLIYNCFKELNLLHLAHPGYLSQVKQAFQCEESVLRTAYPTNPEGITVFRNVTITHDGPKPHSREPRCYIGLSYDYDPEAPHLKNSIFKTAISANSVASWIEDELIPGAGLYVGGAQVDSVNAQMAFPMYVSYCKRQGIKGVSLKVFSTNLVAVAKSQFPGLFPDIEIKKKEIGTFIKGIALNPRVFDANYLRGGKEAPEWEPKNTQQHENKSVVPLIETATHEVLPGSGEMNSGAKQMESESDSSSPIHDQLWEKFKSSSSVLEHVMDQTSAKKNVACDEEQIEFECRVKMMQEVVLYLNREYSLEFKVKPNSSLEYTSKCIVQKDDLDNTKLYFGLKDSYEEPILFCAHKTCTESYQVIAKEALTRFQELYSLEYVNKLHNFYSFEQKDSFREAYAKEGASVVVASTGSGKTYNALVVAIEMALKKKIPVLFFPSKKLVFQCCQLLENMIKARSDLKEKSLQIQVVTSEVRFTYESMYKLFESKKPIIHLTVHSYLRPMGDSPDIAMYSQFLLHYRERVWAFIDEAHLFLKRNIKLIPWQRVRVERFSNNLVLAKTVNALVKGKRCVLVKGEISAVKKNMFG